MRRKLRLLIILFAIALISGCGKSGSLSPKDPGMICDFEQIKPWDISPETGFDLKISDEHVTEGKHSLKVIYPVDGYPSINTKGLTHYWGKYDGLLIDIYNPQDRTLNFTVRLDDGYKKRVNIPAPLAPGTNTVKIPRQKIAASIDAENVFRVVLFLKIRHRRRNCTLII